MIGMMFEVMRYMISALNHRPSSGVKLNWKNFVAFTSTLESQLYSVIVANFWAVSKQILEKIIENFAKVIKN